MVSSPPPPPSALPPYVGIGHEKEERRENLHKALFGMRGIGKYGAITLTKILVSEETNRERERENIMQRMILKRKKKKEKRRRRRIRTSSIPSTTNGKERKLRLSHAREKRRDE